MKHLCLFIITLATSFAANAGQTWKYTAFPLVRPGSVDTLPAKLELGRNTLVAILPKRSGTHPALAVEQLYVDAKSLKRVFVKKNVKVNSDIVIGGWVPIAKGHILHLRTGKTLTAFYAEHLDNRERLKMETQLRASAKKASMVAMLTLMPCAFAETTGTNDAGEVRGAPNTPPSDGTQVGDGFWKCLATELGNSAMETGEAAWESTKGAAAYAYEDPLGAASTVGSYVWDNAYNAGAAVLSAPVKAGKAIYNAASDPKKTWENISNSADQIKKLGIEMYNSVTQSIASFSSLTPEVKTQVLCGIAADAAKEVGMSALMAATGVGGAAAAAKVARFVAKYVAKIKPMMHVLKALGEAENLPEGKVAETVRKILGGQLDAKDAEAIAAKGKDAKIAAEARDAAQDAQERALATSTVKPVDVAAEKARLQGLSMEERTREAALIKTDAERVSAANRAIGRNLTDEQAAALKAAHEVGGNKGYGEYTQGELLRKRKILMASGLKADEADVLIYRGLAGNPSGGYVSASVNFRNGRPDAAPTGAFREAREARRAIYDADSYDDAAQIKAARAALEDTAKKQIYAGDLPGARENLLTSANAEKYVDTFMKDDNRGPLKLTMEGRIEMERQIRVLEGDIYRIDNYTRPGAEGRTYSPDYIKSYKDTRREAIRLMRERIENFREGVYDD